MAIKKKNKFKGLTAFIGKKVLPMKENATKKKKTAKKAA